MHVAVAGASGGTGQHVAGLAATAGYQVTALVRDPGRYVAPDGVNVQQVDDITAGGFELPRTVDVVISTLGNRSSTSPLQVCQLGVARLLDAMQRQGIRRILAVSAAPVLRSSKVDPWWFRAAVAPYVRWAGRRVYADLAQMEETLREAGDWCQWTILRPGFLSDVTVPGEFELAVEDNVRGITRRPDLAAALLDLAQLDAARGRAYGIASR